MSPRSLLLAACLPAVLAVGAAPPALAAGNGHFIGSATGASLNGSSLVTTFKEAGLAAGSAESVLTRATAVTTYECVNGGNKNPSASNKTTTASDVSRDGTFTADKSGNIRGTETLTPPTASALGFSCPRGQTTTFVGVSYSNVSIADTTSHATYSIPGTFSYTNPTAP
ncbi:hypothetical protein QDR37_10570 [Amnibacterium sp. CER49]|uniref:hypothetical protein n=1 Tax=Amnibacterium sp. CER49 TaxID=3039161 RepID=UPI00244CBFE8|nr:hypothetical protein [Amnibacterium sp. CER49]MDH2444386.1 hypothetical protein [Amnibacterium sp. CER49]